MKVFAMLQLVYLVGPERICTHFANAGSCYPFCDVRGVTISMEVGGDGGREGRLPLEEGGYHQTRARLPPTRAQTTTCETVSAEVGMEFPSLPFFRVIWSTYERIVFPPRNVYFLMI